MKIISYNVNGIRSAIGKGLLDWLKEENPDILCLQETKAQPEQIDVAAFESLGYTVFIHSAEKKGYSGVAVAAKQQPDAVFYGIGNDVFDKEGRVLRVDFGEDTIVCVYVPSGTMGGERQVYKMKFLEAFKDYLAQLRKERPNVLICGDFNICHKPIDINHPERQVGVSGFLPEERSWIDGLIADGFVDTFREFDASPEKYSWWSYRFGARSRNAGWRIDYHFVTGSQTNRLLAASILSNVEHSDHCPVLVEIKNL